MRYATRSSKKNPQEDRKSRSPPEKKLSKEPKKSKPQTPSERKNEQERKEKSEKKISNEIKEKSLCNRNIAQKENHEENIKMNKRCEDRKKETREDTNKKQGISMSNDY